MNWIQIRFYATNGRPAAKLGITLRSKQVTLWSGLQGMMQSILKNSANNTQTRRREHTGRGADYQFRRQTEKFTRGRLLVLASFAPRPVGSLPVRVLFALFFEMDSYQLAQLSILMMQSPRGFYASFRKPSVAWRLFKLSEFVSRRVRYKTSIF